MIEGGDEGRACAFEGRCCGGVEYDRCRHTHTRRFTKTIPEKVEHKERNKTAGGRGAEKMWPELSGVEGERKP